MRVLIVKLTSMGDLMHALPAINDAVRHYPHIEFDWVVDENFAEVCHWHPAVKKTIKSAHRRWRKQKLHYWKNGELKGFVASLREQPYDAVVDLQGNLKSGFVTWLCKNNNSHGYDKHSCREKPAHLAYKNRHAVGKNLHAVLRQRQLMAKALGYTLPDDEPDYGVDLSNYSLPDALPDPSPDLAASLPGLDFSKPYVVLVHNASKDNKMWTVAAWQGIKEKLLEQGISVLLPCGSDAEYQRAKTIAGDSVGAFALPKISLNTMAGIISRACACVCSDTGLAHMAAVAGTPAITLYAATDIRLIGTEGKHQQHIVAQGQGGEAATMADISVDQVWQDLQALVS